MTREEATENARGGLARASPGPWESKKTSYVIVPVTAGTKLRRRKNWGSKRWMRRASGLL
jgi:hypothetical protein